MVYLVKHLLYASSLPAGSLVSMLSKVEIGEKYRVPHRTDKELVDPYVESDLVM